MSDVSDVSHNRAWYPSVFSSYRAQSHGWSVLIRSHVGGHLGYSRDLTVGINAAMTVGQRVTPQDTDVAPRTHVPGGGLLVTQSCHRPCRQDPPCCSRGGCINLQIPRNLDRPLRRLTPRPSFTSTPVPASGAMRQEDPGEHSEWRMLGMEGKHVPFR